MVRFAKNIEDKYEKNNDIIGRTITEHYNLMNRIYYTSHSKNKIFKN